MSIHSWTHTGSHLTATATYQIPAIILRNYKKKRWQFFYYNRSVASIIIIIIIIIKRQFIRCS